MNDPTEHIDSESSIDEQQQEHKSDEVGDLRDDMNQGSQDNFDIFLGPHQSDDPHDSESSDNGCCCWEAGPGWEDVEKYTYVCSNNHDAIEKIPSRVEVLAAKSHELENHFHVEDEGKHIVQIFKKSLKTFVHSIELYCHYESIEAYEEGNDSIKHRVGNKIEHSSPPTRRRIDLLLQRLW